VGDLWRELSPLEWERKVNAYPIFAPGWDVVRLQRAIAYNKRGTSKAKIGLANHFDPRDPLLPHIIWRAMQPVLAGEVQIWKDLLHHHEDADVPLTSNLA